MKLGTMLGDVATSLFRNHVTRPYPFRKTAAPERLRGALQFVNREACTGCGMCAKDCPAAALDVIVLDKAAKRFVIKYHGDCCTFCAQCVASCNHGCLVMSHTDWEMAAFNRDRLLIYYGETADVAQVLAGIPATGTDADPAG